MKKVKTGGHKNFFINLHAMCRDYSKSPSEYLFPDCECPHFRFLVDTMVWNVGAPVVEEKEWKKAALSAGAKISNL